MEGLDHFTVGTLVGRGGQGPNQVWQDARAVSGTLDDADIAAEVGGLIQNRVRHFAPGRGQPAKIQEVVGFIQTFVPKPAFVLPVQVGTLHFESVGVRLRRCALTMQR